MADVRYCPWDRAIMTYDAASGIYTCPDCGYQEHDEVMANSSTEEG